MIELSKITVQFGGVKPLNELSLTIDGDVVGIVGPNGAGKTTLLNVLSGFVQPTEGRVSVDGTDITAMPAFKRSRWGVRRTFQTEQVAETTPVRDHVTVMLDAIKLSSRERTVAVDRALAVTELAGVQYAPAGVLNSYERRRLEIARAIVGSPRVVMMDEPAAGLSETESASFRSLVLSLRAETGAMVVLIDHDVELITAVCGTTAVLDFGKLIGYGPTAEVLALPAVKAAYLGTADESLDEVSA
jgi:branched-chain amino acid transport system ATP-binding protein